MPGRSSSSTSAPATSTPPATSPAPCPSRSTSWQHGSREIPADVEVVAYCRGRYCVLSHRAVRLLIDHGFDARLAADGMLEWTADGVPIDHAER